MGNAKVDACFQLSVDLPCETHIRRPHHWLKSSTGAFVVTSFATSDANKLLDLPPFPPCDPTYCLALHSIQNRDELRPHLRISNPHFCAASSPNTLPKRLQRARRLRDRHNHLGRLAAGWSESDGPFELDAYTTSRITSALLNIISELLRHPSLPHDNSGLSKPQLTL